MLGGVGAAKKRNSFRIIPLEDENGKLKVDNDYFTGSDFILEYLDTETGDTTNDN
jgi:hypothetical protein